MKIIFISTAEFGVPALEKLIASKYQPEFVITSPDKPAGRKQVLTPFPVKKEADKWQIPVLQPNNIGKIKEKLKEIEPDLMIVVAYGQLLPKSILDIPKKGTLNIHPSLLPKYRGSSPIQNAILNNDTETGVTIMQIDEKMDHGPILGQIKAKINTDETAESLHNRLAYLSADYLMEILPKYLNNEITLQPQDDSKATFTKILTREDGKIDLNKKAEEIERQIRAYYPWPGTWLIYKGKRLKILKVKVADSSGHQALKTKDKYLLPELVQPEGKKPMEWDQFLRGVK